MPVTRSLGALARRWRVVGSLLLASALLAATPCARGSAQDASDTDVESATVESATEAEQAPSEAEIAEARHSFDVASRAFDEGDYETAAAEFRTAYQLLRDPDLLFNLYLAEERAGRQREAASALAGYLAGATVEPEQRTMLEARLARLRERATRTESGAIDAGGDAPLASSALATDTGPPVAAIATLIASGALWVSFAVLATLSEVEDQALASECGRDVGRFCSASRVSTLETLNVAADASWIGGAVLGALGIVFLFTLPPERGAAHEARITPRVGAGSAGLEGSVQF